MDAMDGEGRLALGEAPGMSREEFKRLRQMVTESRDVTVLDARTHHGGLASWDFGAPDQDFAQGQRGAGRGDAVALPDALPEELLAALDRWVAGPLGLGELAFRTWPMAR